MGLYAKATRLNHSCNLFFSKKNCGLWSCSFPLEAQNNRHPVCTFCSGRPIKMIIIFSWQERTQNKLSCITQNHSSHPQGEKITLIIIVQLPRFRWHERQCENLSDILIINTKKCDDSITRPGAERRRLHPDSPVWQNHDTLLWRCCHSLTGFAWLCSR